MKRLPDFNSEVSKTIKHRSTWFSFLIVQLEVVQLLEATSSAKWNARISLSCHLPRVELGGKVPSTNALLHQKLRSWRHFRD